MAKTEWIHQKLAADEKFSISFNEVFGLVGGAKLAGSDIAVKADYQWWFVPIQFHKTFRLVAREQTDGSFRWFFLPLDDPH